MTTVAIDYIWKAIQEFERSDGFQFIDAVTRSTQQQTDRSGAIGRESITAAATELLPMHSNSLPTVTLPL